MDYDAMINNILKYEFEEDSMLDESDLGSSQTEYIMNSINEIVKEKMLELCMIWVEIGIPKKKRINRLDEVKSLVEEQTIEIFNTIKDTENKTLNDLKDYRLTKLQEINNILNDLKLAPFELPSNVNLFNTAKILHYKFKDLNNLKKERIKRWTELKTQKSQLCTLLGCTNKSFNLDTGIPSDEEVMNLQTYVLDLKKLRDERTKELEDYRNKLMVLFGELEYSPANDYERQFFDNKQFILSDNNMKQLPKLFEKLETMHEQNKLAKSMKMEKLNSLWKKLSIDTTEQEAVRRVIEDCKPSTLQYMQTKIAELEELKRQNIGTFIAKLRPEIEEWWEKCCISEEKVASFADKYFTITEVNDEILEIHEQELERLQKFYCENESIFLKCNKLHNGQTFTIYGKPIEIYFAEYYESLQIAKENEKEKKKIIKKQELEAQSRLVINSPCRSEKTKRMASQTASSTKRFKPLGINRNQAGVSKPTAAATTSRKGVAKSLRPEFAKKGLEADVQIEINTIINESQFQSIRNDTFENRQHRFGFNKQLQQTPTSSTTQKPLNSTRRMTRSAAAAAQILRNPLTPLRMGVRNSPAIKHSPFKIRSPIKSPIKRHSPVKRSTPIRRFG